jgi:alpha-N-acetylglucosamine transferase
MVYSAVARSANSAPMEPYMDYPSPFLRLPAIVRAPPRSMVRVAIWSAITSLLCIILYQYTRYNGSLPLSAGKNAIAVLLAENYKDGVQQDDIDADDYFLATRLLNYQIRHSKSTKYHDSYVPLLVLVTPEVAENKRRMLTKEGATIIPVEPIAADWVTSGIESGNWKSVLSKLQLWTLTDYDRILLLDSDTLLITSLDGIFDDVAAQTYSTNFSPSKIDDKTVSANATGVLAPLPPTYVFGGIMEGVSGDRERPINPDYLNAGFFLMSPSLRMYEYYMSLLRTPGLFEPSMPEQNLLNYAHRRDGPMPWKQLDDHWNTNCASESDVRNGWRTVHGRWWVTDNFRREGSPICTVDPMIGTTWWRIRGHMEAYYAQWAP